MKFLFPLIFFIAAEIVFAADLTEPTPPAPREDRVGFPKGYAERFEVLRTVDKEKDMKVVTIYGNKLAASDRARSQLPYPYGSVIVMETAKVPANEQGEPLRDSDGQFSKDEVLGLHVMRRGRNFGEAYEAARSGEWEFVEYRADGGYITPPAKSTSCAECHIKAGPEADFVFQGRLR